MLRRNFEQSLMHRFLVEEVVVLGGWLSYSHSTSAHCMLLE